MSVTIGNGNLDDGCAVMEASDGTKIAVFLDSGVIEVWKSIDGTPSSVDTEIASVVHGGGAIGHIHAAIDSNDDIHVVSACTSEQTRDIAYCICDLSTGFATWEQAANYTEQEAAYPYASISIDSSDKPHVVFTDAVKVTGSTADNVYYTNKVSGWLTPEPVGTRAVKTDIYNQGTLCHCPSDDIEAWYRFMPGNPSHKRRNGTWGTETEFTEAASSLNTVICTTGDVVHRYHIDNSNNLEEDNSEIGYSAYARNSYRASASLVGTDRYIFYIDSGQDVHLVSNDGGGWTDEGDLQTGTYEFVVAQWSYHNNGQSGEINYLFDDGTNIYYDSFPISGDYTVSETDDTVIGESVTVEPLELAGVVETDGLTVGDSVTARLIPLVSETDGLTIGDTVSIDALLREVSEADGLTIGESITAALDALVISEADGLTIADVIDEIIVAAISDYEIDKSDGITLGESVTAALDNLILSKADGIVLADTVVDISVVGGGGPDINVAIAMDDMAYWIQGVKVAG